MKAKISKFLIITILLFSSLKINASDSSARKPDESGYVDINNLKIYYEIYGKGEPLLYLHGGLSSSKDIKAYIPAFTKNFKLIVFDRKGHGRSSDDDKEFSYASMAKTTSLFMEKLGIDSAKVIGWSDGGVVGFHLASSEPSKVKKLIAVGANYLVEGLNPSSFDWIKNVMSPEFVSKNIPSIEKDYKRLNPNPENYNSFIIKTRDMWLRDPYISLEEFKKIDIPVLLVAGDRKDIQLEHMIEMHSILSNSQLSILPNTNHFVFSQYSESFSNIMEEFLK